jgi:hypothetical protein
MANAKEVSLFYGEGLREAGILILVFGPMYSVFETKDGGWMLALDVLFWMTGGIVLFHTGIELERRNR